MSTSDLGTRDLSRTEAYDYALPPELVATVPAEERTQSRLLVLSPKGVPRHLGFSDLPDQLSPGSVLVRNTARVLPMRLRGRKATGGQTELLVLDPIDAAWTSPGPVRFRALARSNRPLRAGALVTLDASEHVIRILARQEGGLVACETTGSESLATLLHQCGEMPLPPYIQKARTARGESIGADLDRRRYQTVYADEPGAAAAPTAGLHFSDATFAALEARDIQVVDVRLNVGVGTFRPITAERLDEHELHTERYHLCDSAAASINNALDDDRTLIALGTTAFRVLEDQAVRGPRAEAGSFDTDLFVRPGKTVRWVDGLVTNFHLPASSLLTLVCAVGGYDPVMAAYADAVRRRYRFYSYGDAMLVWRHS